MNYIKYLRKVLLHKWYVFVAGMFSVGGIPIYRLLWHDLSKFTWLEFTAYAHYFFGERDNETKMMFDKAWNHHQKCNKHHWEYWILIDDPICCLPMPETYIKEMVADWMGASMAYTGSWDMTEWLSLNLPELQLHPMTRNKLYQILRNLGYHV